MQVFVMVFSIVFSTTLLAQSEVKVPLSSVSGTKIINGRNYIVDSHCFVYNINDLPPTQYIKPLLPLPDVELPTRYTFTSETIKTLPYTDIADMIAYLPAVRQTSRGSFVDISTGGKYGVLYVVDGMVVMR
jgi:hypothetical protein